MQRIEKLAVVMSGGVNTDSSLPMHVKARCDYAVQPENNFQAIVVSSSFSLNTPPKRDEQGFPKSEASVGYQYIKSLRYGGLLLCEQLSHDTVGSVFFCLDLIASSMGNPEVHFVTNDFHKHRSELVCAKISEILRYPSRTMVIGVPCAAPKKAREIKESEAAENFERNYSGISSRAHLILELIKNHTNYNHHYSGTVVDCEQMLY